MGSSFAGATSRCIKDKSGKTMPTLCRTFSGACFGLGAASLNSWNTSHPSRGPDGGCSQNDLISTGGAGLLYCFAAN